jgi:sugar phosphate permease
MAAGAEPATGTVTRPSRVRYVVLSLTLLLIAVAYLDRVCIATAAPAIRRELGFDAEQMGFVFSAFTLSYALFEIPSGYLADRFGARAALTRIVAWWSLMTALTGLATGFASLLAFRFLFGIGEAGAFPSTARVYARWLPAKERGRAFGLAIATGAVAGAVTMKLVVVLLGFVSWRAAFACFGSVGVVWAALWWLYFRDEPREHPGVNGAELAAIFGDARHPEDGAHRKVPWGAIFRLRSLALLCPMYVCAIYGWYFFLTWMPTYLADGRALGLERAGSLASLPLLGIGAGVLTGGWASDRLAARFGSRARRVPGMVSFPLAALSAGAAALCDDATLSALLLSLAAALGAAGVAPAWAVCLEVGGNHAGVVTAAMNMFGNFGGALCPVVVGVAVKRFGSWPTALATVAGAYAVAAVLWAFVDPERDRLETPEPFGSRLSPARSRSS